MENWTIILSILIGVFAIYYYLFSKKQNIFQKNGVPYAKPISIPREVYEILMSPKPYVNYIQNFYYLYPDAKYLGIFTFSKAVVMIRDIELIKSITIKNFDSFEDHHFFGPEIEDPLFKNLITLTGNKWRNIRSLLSPSFTSSKMKMMYTLMSECAINFSEYVRNVPSEKRVIELKDIFTRYATDVIATCAFGLKVDSMKNPQNNFYVYGKKVTDFNVTFIMKLLLCQYLPILMRLFKIRIMDNRASEFFTNLIADTIRTRDEKGITRPDMLQLMMDTRGKGESGKELSIEEMTSQAFVFFLGGFESSSILMCFAAHEIAINPDIQERLRDEIDKILDETNGQLSYEAINKMEYLNAVINETLRMYPSTPLLDRLCVKDFELPAALPDGKPYLVKKGTILMIPHHAIQHDIKYFPDPEKFKPGRFLNKNEDPYNSDAYFPFGLGPRMCIGNRFALLETKLLLFHLLARCELQPCEKTSIPLKLKSRGFSMTAENGFWLNVVPRNNCHSTMTKK